MRTIEKTIKLLGETVIKKQAELLDKDIVYSHFESCKKDCFNKRSCVIGECYRKIVMSIGNKVNPIYMVIGEGPGADEIEQNQPFIGCCGKYLRSFLKKYNLNKTNTIITNTIPCRPKDNKFPEDENQVKLCVNLWIKNEIKILKPKVILCLGSKATKYVYGGDKKITEIRGKSIRDDRAYWVFTYHPAYVLRNLTNKKIINDFENDIKYFKNLGEAYESKK